MLFFPQYCNITLTLVCRTGNGWLPTRSLLDACLIAKLLFGYVSISICQTRQNYQQIVRRQCCLRWFAEQVMADSPLGAPSACLNVLSNSRYYIHLRWSCFKYFIGRYCKNVKSLWHWFAEQVMADSPLGAPSRTKSLRNHNEEKPPVQPPADESHANVRGCSHITSVGGVRKFQQKEFKGTKNVGRNNWFKFNNIC